MHRQDAVLEELMVAPVALVVVEAAEDVGVVEVVEAVVAAEVVVVVVVDVGANAILLKGNCDQNNKTIMTRHLLSYESDYLIRYSTNKVNKTF